MTAASSSRLASGLMRTCRPALFSPSVPVLVSDRPLPPVMVE